MADSERIRRAQLGERVRRFVEPSGDERALDAGAGTGALAFALAPLVREVVAVDLVPQLLDQGRKETAAFPNVTFIEGDITSLPDDLGEFDLAGTHRALHHLRRPELAVSELARVTRSSGRVLVIDQIASPDPLASLELDRFDRTRDPTHRRTLPQADLRHLFEANGLRLIRSQVEAEERNLEHYLDLAGCTGAQRKRARTLAPAGRTYVVEVGWYLLLKP